MTDSSKVVSRQFAVGGPYIKSAALVLASLIVLGGHVFATMGYLDWRLCFHNQFQEPRQYPVSLLTLFVLAVEATMAHPKGLLLNLSLSAPLLIVTGVAKNRVTQLFAIILLTLLLLSVLEPSSMNTCDRKGCHGCFDYLVLQFIMLPIGVGTMLHILVDRFIMKRA